MLRTVTYVTLEDLVLVVYLSANRIVLVYEGLELGIGDASIIKALVKACGRTESHIKNQYKVNLCLVAKASHSSQYMMWKPDALAIKKVFNTFLLIAKCTNYSSAYLFKAASRQAVSGE
ncbi:hypothetical protein RJT34_16206 [Clitoria ternatea]|uniref:DNA ligase ATP-dependent N-terminal domain-containing protein n=1 Tax=Clitoria ternatea TaxID=43366 RepID=A0AAN9PC44_CLITE